jgi:signal transduction histidine kinase
MKVEESGSAEPMTVGAASGGGTRTASTHARRLSHELRTPLNAILGNVELLLDGTAGPLAAEARRCVAEVQTASHELLRQSRMLLLLIEVLEVPAPVEEAALDLAQLFHQAWQEVRPAAPLEIAERARGSHLVGDPCWLRTLARTVAEAGRPAATGIVRIGLGDGPVLTLDWQGLDGVELSATTVVLIDAIARVHGGCLVRTAGRGLALHLPGKRIGRSAR